MHTGNILISRLVRSLLLVFLMVMLMGVTMPHAAEGDHNTTDDKAGDPSHFELDEIVVTAAKVEEPVKQTPRNVTVITAEDIAESPSNNIIDLLGREAGINVRSLQGTDRQAVIDIRGMGATAASNVVVLVDGVRLNSPDLSGPDLSSISLDQIERIEVVRGSGGVLYGSGAVGGVVNIVTKKGTLGTQVDASASYGSYNTIDAWASLRGGYKDLSYSLNGMKSARSGQANRMTTVSRRQEIRALKLGRTPSVFTFRQFRSLASRAMILFIVIQSGLANLNRSSATGALGQKRSTTSCRLA